MVIELVVPIKKGVIHFSIQRTVFFLYSARKKNRPNSLTRGFSAITQ